MGILDKIENLQKKPESYRKKILYSSLFLIMSLIILIWLSGLNFSITKEEKQQIVDASPAKVLSEDFKVLKDSFFSIIKNED